MKKHYRIVITIDNPYPFSFTYHEEANGLRAAVARSVGVFRKEPKVAGRPMRHGRIEWFLIGSINDPVKKDKPDDEPEDPKTTNGVNTAVVDADYTEAAEGSEEEDEGVDFDTLISMLKTAPGKEKIKEIEEKYIKPFDWSKPELKQFEKVIKAALDTEGEEEPNTLDKILSKANKK